MKRLGILFTTAVLALVLSSCSAEENHENTTQTDPPASESQSPTDTGENMGDKMNDAAEDLGDGVKDAANATKNAAEDIVK